MSRTYRLKNVKPMAYDLYTFKWINGFLLREDPKTKKELKERIAVFHSDKKRNNKAPRIYCKYFQRKMRSKGFRELSKYKNNSEYCVLI